VSNLDLVNAMKVAACGARADSATGMTPNRARDG